MLLTCIFSNRTAGGTPHSALTLVGGNLATLSHRENAPHEPTKLNKVYCMLFTGRIKFCLRYDCVERVVPGE